MAWIKQTLGDWDQFYQVAGRDRGLMTSFRVTALFRGQSNASWSLKPSLTRLLRSNDRLLSLQVEREATSEFKARAHLLISPSLLADREYDMDWWFLMQHHHAPTRLLDWSDSIWVAAYFAVVDNPNEDGAIWMVNTRELKSADIAAWGEFDIAREREGRLIQSPASDDRIIIPCDELKSERMIAQGGNFTMCVDPTTDHAEIIDQMLSGKSLDVYSKLIIRSQQKPDFLKRLRSMNLHANALFPGLDGIGRSIAELVYLRGHFEI